MNEFTELEIIEFDKLVLNDKETPFFDPMRYCLRWKDEEPKTVSKDIYEKFLDLIIARSFIHKGLPKNRWYFIRHTNYFCDYWEYALSVIPNWPGFQRLILSKKDREYFENELNKDL
ncbi:MAG: hypothetical protein SAJ12_20655, partial [Jaaginema sp. PMC 1079.18]|nr:hypothetical protein [Jaaginema sp. PMC 1079.18]